MVRAIVLLLLAAVAFGRELPRRAQFGVATQGSARGGVAISAVQPGTTAEAIGLVAGDVVTSLQGVPTPDAGAFLAAVRSIPVGAALSVGILRGDAAGELKGTMLGMPKESRPDADTVYGSVESDGALLRTVLTKPGGDGPFPAILLIQGLGPMSVDAPLNPAMVYRRFIDHWTRSGFATLRVEKPGVGDSEGGPHDQVDFDRETRGFLAGLRSLAATPGVDPKRLHIFGHSMGGIMAPILARQVPVRRICVYGTSALTWLEYELENHRRQERLLGVDPAELDARQRARAPFLAALYEGKEPLDRLLESHPGMREAYPGGLVYGKTPAFFLQLAKLNVAEQWKGTEAEVLSIWGESDFVTGPRDHLAVIDAVNHGRAPRARYLAQPGIDHGFAKAESQEESFAAMQRRERPPFDESILEAVTAFFRQ